MNEVPYAFCDDVASIIEKITPLCRMKSDSDECCAWKTAFADHHANRVRLKLEVCFIHGRWRYQLREYCSFYVTSEPVELRDILKTSRKYIHLCALSFDQLEFNSPSSLKEIKRILTFLRPCVAQADLNLNRTEAPNKAIVDLLALFISTPFEQIFVLKYSTAFEYILEKQIKLESLKHFHDYDGCQPAAALKAEFEKNRGKK